MKKIVVAESSPTIKNVADTLLRQNGYNVVCTSDGLQAWEVVKMERPDLVLTALNLSGINGLELCRQMSGDNIAGGIPIIMMVGANDNISEDDLITAGVRGRLKKPFSPRDLLIVVRKLIGEGEAAPRTLPGSKDTEGTTNYQARIFSTTSHLENSKNEVYNLDWTDLNDNVSRTAAHSQDGDAESAPDGDQEIKISANQFDLESLNSGNEEDQKSDDRASKDEDYDWFVGEIKKDTSAENAETKKESSAPEETTKSARSVFSSESADLKFDDFGSADSKILLFNEAKADLKTALKQSDSVKTAPAVEKLTDDDIYRIADRVAQRLAAAMAASIDRQKIIKAIKEVME